MKQQKQKKQKQNNAGKKSKSKSKPASQAGNMVQAMASAASKIAIHLPETTREYIRSLCAPDQVRNVGMPASDSSIATTLKQHAFAKGTLTIGTGGVGFIVLAPGRAVSNTTSCAYVTDNTFAGTVIDTSAIAGVNDVFSNSPFLGIDYGAAPLAEFRIVTAGLKVRYSGTTLNQGGTVYALQQPKHEDLLLAGTNEIAGYVQGKRFAVDRNWSHVNYCPLSGAWANSVTGSGYSNFFMAILVEGVVGTTFDYELCVNWEMYGRNVRGQTPSINDPIGYGAVSAAMAEHGGAFHGSPAKVEQGLMSRIGNLLTSATTWIGPAIQTALPMIIEHAPTIIGAAAALL